MRRKVLASALSVLLVTASVPVPAIAEGIDDVQPVAIEQAAAPEEAADEAADGEQVPADNATEPAADEATASDAGEAVVDEAAETENAIAAEEPAAEATDEAEGADAEAATVADVADTAAATPATQAAGDPYETEAPAYTAADLARIYGSVSYRVDDGSSKSTTVVSADNFAYVGTPMKNNETGGWKIVTTLKADGTADDYGLKSWDLGGVDPASLHIDEDVSDLSVTFETSSASDDSWGVAANGRASLVFTAAEQLPAQPAQPGITDVIEAPATINYTLKNAEDGTYDAAVAIGSDARMASISSVYWNDALSAWAVDVTLRQFDTPADYGIEVPAFFAGDYELDADASTLTTTLVYQDGSWERAYGSTANLVFTEKVAKAPEFDLSQVTSKVLSYDITGNGLKPKSYGMRGNEIPANMVESISDPVQNEDGGWDIVVTLKNGTAADYGVPEGYLRGQAAEDMVIDTSAETKMQFTAKTDNPTDTTWTVYAGDKAEFTFVYRESVPTANADGLAAVSNSVNYSMQRAEGGAYEARTSIGSTENIESIGEVYKNSDGAWAVDVTLKSDADPADYGLDNEVATQGKPYKLDVDSSKLVATFVWTKGVLGYSWKCNGTNQAKLVFKEVTAPAFDINNELNTWGTVTYDLKHADGTSDLDNGTHLVKADNIASVGEPYQTADGCWAVDVTLKDTATTDDYQVPSWKLHDGDYALDSDASDLTMTFRTNGLDGTTWYCSGSDRANLVFAEQADAPGENPGEDTENPGEDTEKPGTGTGTEQPGDDTKVPVTDDAQDKGNASDDQAKDTQEAAADEDTLTQTGDPADGLAVIAAGGVLAVVAGIELKRRSAGERL